MESGKRIRITDIMKEDAFFHRREELIGQTGELISTEATLMPGGIVSEKWSVVDVQLDTEERVYFWGCKFEEEYNDKKN